MKSNEPDTVVISMAFILFIYIYLYKVCAGLSRLPVCLPSLCPIKLDQPYSVNISSHQLRLFFSKVNLQLLILFGSQIPGTPDILYIRWLRLFLPVFYGAS